MTTIEVPNLLGDSLYASYAVRRYIELHPDEQVECVMSSPSWCSPIYSYIEGVTGIRDKREGEVCNVVVNLSSAFSKDVGTYGGNKPFWHVISEDLGMNTEDMKSPPVKIPRVTIPRAYQGRVLLSPYSASCASREDKPANKMLSAYHWQAVFDLVYELWRVGHIGKPLFIGGPGESILHGTLPEFEMLGSSVEFVAEVVHQARCIIGVDTGTIRLANMLGTPAFFTTPLGLGKMFLPDWGGETIHETGHPATYKPHQFRDSVERFLRDRF